MTMSRVRHDAISRSQQEWNQAAPFRIDFTHGGLRADCMKCGAGRVTWRFVGVEGFMPTFQFECECGNVAKRSVFNSASGFPETPAGG